MEMSICRSLQILRIAKHLNVYNNELAPRINKVAYSKESFLSGTNANFLENQYLDWSQSKGSIDSSWDSFYDSICGPALKIEDVEDEFTPRKNTKKSADAVKETSQETIMLHLAVQNLIRSYQTRGHLLSKTDPLELTIPAKMLAKGMDKPLNIMGFESRLVSRELGSILSEKHMDMVFTLPDRTFIGGTEKALTLREIIRRLEFVYCGPIGAEYMHLYDLNAVNFIRQRLETPGSYTKTTDEKKLIQKRLTKAVLQGTLAISYLSTYIDDIYIKKGIFWAFVNNKDCLLGKPGKKTFIL